MAKKRVACFTITVVKHHIQTEVAIKYYGVGKRTYPTLTSVTKAFPLNLNLSYFIMRLKAKVQ